MRQNLANECAEPMDLDALARTFREDGFVELRGYFSGAELQTVRSRTVALMARLEKEQPVDPASKYATVRKNLQAHDPWALDFLNNGPHMAVLERLIGTVVPATFGWFDKRPGEHDEVQPHVDAVGGTRDGATVWIALDPVTKQSGCLHYLRGSHRQGFPLKVGIDISGHEADHRAMEAEPGDVFIHSSGTVHWSDHNQTDVPRRAVVLFYWGQAAADANFKAKLAAKSAKAAWRQPA